MHAPATATHSGGTLPACRLCGNLPGYDAITTAAFEIGGFLPKMDTMKTSETSARRLIVIGCLCAALGVAAGAFGAHMLKSLLDPPMLAVYETAARYQMYHAFGIVLSGFAVHISRDARVAAAGWMFLAGILLFSGSLYGVALFGVRRLGALTPLGGVAFIAGWLFLAWQSRKSLLEEPHG